MRSHQEAIHCSVMSCVFSPRKPIRPLSLALSSPSTCQIHCPPQEKSKPMQACSCDLFNGHLPTVPVLLFREPFLPGFGAISKGASVFSLREAWRSLLAGCDYGPHMVVLQWLTKTGGLGSWAQAPALPPLPPPCPQSTLLLSLLCGPFHVASALPGPFVLLSWGPVPLYPLTRLCEAPPTKCRRQVFQKCSECKSFCPSECA